MASGIGRRRAAAKEDGAEAYQIRRKEIADAAARVFNRTGFQGATIAAVAEELNIDRASLYYYVSNKEELFDDVIRETSLENVATAQRIQRSSVSPPEKLRQLIVELMSSYGKNYPLLYIYIRENLKHVAGPRSKWAQQMRQLNRDYDNAVTAIIEEGYANGTFQNIGPSRIVAYGIIGMMGWTNRWFKPADSIVSAEEIGEMYARMAIAGLSPDVSGRRAPRDPASAAPAKRPRLPR
ncbi:MAG: TetR/AcrR family transcriptional regulator, cholesterol catabolism regulator [Gammaproteobacteria bacterium]|nr:TetR/AcrR family transcriptional regulator, cholesterol catabolism regulator [Gammaproteobacteria bacterium]